LLSTRTKESIAASGDSILMGDEGGKSSATVRQSASSDMATIVENIPIAGKLLSSFFKISSRGKAIVLTILLLLIVYPLVSLGMALFIISISPSSVQKAAKSFILSSIGVDQEMLTRIDRSNLVIDALIPLKFTFGGEEQTVQRVAVGQKIRFDAFMRSDHIDRGQECAIEQSMPDESIGVLTVRSLASEAQPYKADIPPKFGELFLIGTLSRDKWNDFEQKAISDEKESEHPLKIKVTESTNPAVADYLKCHTVTINVYMTIFKPLMMSASK
jgi:hypothetical protein